MKELTLEATIEHVRQVTEFVDAQLETVPCQIKARRLIDIAVDEIFSNIAHYAYAPQTGMATIRVEICEEEQTVEITFMDRGIPFDPLAHANPVQGRPSKLGGMGISIVRRSMDQFLYEHTDGYNVTKLIKRYA